MAASSIALLLLSTTAAAAYTPRRRVQPPKALLRTVRGGSSPAQDTASAPPPAAVHPTWAPLAPLPIGPSDKSLGGLGRPKFGPRKGVVLLKFVCRFAFVFCCRCLCVLFVCARSVAIRLVPLLLRRGSRRHGHVC